MRKHGHAVASTESTPKTSSAISAPQTNVITFKYPNVNTHSNINVKTARGTRNTTQNGTDNSNGKHLDFIGPDTAVKDLFGLPYSSDVGVAVAIHNIGDGTLLIDGAVVHDASASASASDARTRNKTQEKRRQQRQQQRRKGSRRRRPYADPIDVNVVDIKTGTSAGTHGSGFGFGSRLGSQALQNEPPQSQEEIMTFLSSMLETQNQLLTGESLNGRNSNDISTGTNGFQTGMLKNETPLLESSQKHSSHSTNAATAPNSVNVLAKSPGKELSIRNPSHLQRILEPQPQQQQWEPKYSSGFETSRLLEDALPTAESYTEDVASASSTSNDPRFYQQWEFRGYNMLVGCDAIVVNGNGNNSNNDDEQNAQEDDSNMSMSKDGEGRTGSVKDRTKVRRTNEKNNVLTLRIANGEILRSKLDQQEQHVRSTQRSYAEALNKEDAVASKGISENAQEAKCKIPVKQQGDEKDQIVCRGETSIVAAPYPDFARVSMQSCVLPTSAFQRQLHEHGFSAKPVDPTADGTAPSSSPVCMVLDAYLDNIIANVPQLALCLEEKGILQAVKLFETHQLPTLSTNDLLSSSDAVNRNASSERPTTPLFSPSIVESNAAMMLEFLKTNCSRENSTYLLKRNAGETSIQLLDVTSLSRQRHRKWIYWLAMMSLRFAMRLDRLAERTDDEPQRRDYRRKKRGLLENALELLHELDDMGGGKHETIRSSIYEQLADTFLSKNEQEDRERRHGFDSFECSFLRGNLEMSSQLYSHISNDSLSKAQDLLLAGIKELRPALTHSFENQKEQNDIREDKRDVSLEVEAVALQLYGIHHKLINVTLSLSEIHLIKYRSSSVMQALRLTARIIADASELLERVGFSQMEGAPEEILGHKSDVFVRSLAYQYAWLLENCGNFARSFAADEAWRERGHACGEDVIALLLDVELLSTVTNRIVITPNSCKSAAKNDSHCIDTRTRNVVNLHYLSGMLPLSSDGTIVTSPKATVEKANSFLRAQKQLKKDKRRVLVAAALLYSKGAEIFAKNVAHQSKNDTSVYYLMLQRLGDACNEVGKVLLEEVRVAVKTKSRVDLVMPFLLSAEFWFKEGLRNFKLCSDTKNIAFLRCNMSACCKIRSNSTSSRMNFLERQEDADKDLDTHAEICLNDAARHLELAHEALEQRHVNPKAWDMVSLELAATYLVLGVRRRQSLIGSGPSPVVLQERRLNPGSEQSIIEPIQRARDIYTSLNVPKQAAAANYQLALYYSKVWTCQRNEMQTKYKLSKAFEHFGHAHKFYFSHLRSNEGTLVCLILDLSSLYSTTSVSYECQQKALLCCLDTCEAFSESAVREAKVLGGAAFIEWYDKMSTLNDKMEEKILVLLSSLVKIEKRNASLPHKYEDIYRNALRIKLSSTRAGGRDGTRDHFRVHQMLSLVKLQHIK